jgi:hypothetical protein
VPDAENKWVGVKEVDVLFAPLEGSSKFHEAWDMFPIDKMENEILFSRQLLVEAIIPSQHNPMDILLHTVETGKPGS